ncbi:transmembrane protein 135-like isoform X3 [Dermacentor albipictus]|uniref:transmembrane protein 135-like isoform X3 n=1 Tax=Dermacentor albipictus TaxID=60249 RepID=UPI0031FC4E33
MAVLSKLLETSLPFRCYEIAHPWEPSCTASWVTLFFDTFSNSIKLYSVLYLVAQLVSRKTSRRAFAETVLSSIRSASFLSYNVMLFMFVICALRWGFGRLYLQNSTFVAGLASGFLSIFVEHPSRRRVLSVYMLNQCSEIVFNSLRSRNIVHDVPRGEVAMFAVSLAGFLYCIRNNNKLKDPVCRALRLLMGAEEFAAPTAATDTGQPCWHLGSCWRHAAEGMPAPFLIGYGLQALLSLASPHLRRRPWRILGRWAPLAQGAFLASTVGLFRVLYCQAARKGYAPTLAWGSELLFALGCGVMMFCAVVEPHNMRPSYAKFLNDMTGDRLRRVNRHPLEVLGFHCSSVYPEYFPQLDQRYVSRHFVERVLVWS